MDVGLQEAPELPPSFEESRTACTLPVEGCYAELARLTGACWEAHREQRLWLDGGVHRARIEVVQKGSQQPQALLRRVIPIEPEARVRGVVVPLMEGLEPAHMFLHPSYP